MPFPYYARLSSRRQAIYRKSDAVSEVRITQAETLYPVVGALREALLGDHRPAVGRAAQQLCDELLAKLALRPIRVQVLAVRPHGRGGELHGLYTDDERDPPRIQVWMRTARHRRAVAFRSFLRTLLHEICHHLDYRHLRFADSYHTEGFFRRESSLFRQLVPGEDPQPVQKRPIAARPPRIASKETSPQEDQPVQQRLPFD
jgi:hypothetical protein